MGVNLLATCQKTIDREKEYKPPTKQKGTVVPMRGTVAWDAYFRETRKKIEQKINKLGGVWCEVGSGPEHKIVEEFPDQLDVADEYYGR